MFAAGQWKTRDIPLSFVLGSLIMHYEPTGEPSFRNEGTNYGRTLCANEE